MGVKGTRQLPLLLLPPCFRRQLDNTHDSHSVPGNTANAQWKKHLMHGRIRDIRNSNKLLLAQFDQRSRATWPLHGLCHTSRNACELSNARTNVIPKTSAAHRMRVSGVRVKRQPRAIASPARADAGGRSSTPEGK